VGGSDDGFLFLTELGESMVPEYVTHRMRRYVEAADVGKKGSCHIFRHTMATAMLDNGADVRFVQEMLGHASPATTQIYTHLSIKKLSEVHALTHPSATMKGLKKNGTVAVDDPRPVSREPDHEDLIALARR
jgi:integrase/recombinase XerD